MTNLAAQTVTFGTYFVAFKMNLLFLAISMKIWSRMHVEVMCHFHTYKSTTLKMCRKIAMSEFVIELFLLIYIASW